MEIGSESPSKPGLGSQSQGKGNGFTSARQEGDRLESYQRGGVERGLRRDEMAEAWLGGAERGGGGGGGGAGRGPGPARRAHGSR